MPLARLPSVGLAIATVGGVVSGGGTGAAIAWRTAWYAFTRPYPKAVSYPVAPRSSLEAFKIASAVRGEGRIDGPDQGHNPGSERADERSSGWRAVAGARGGGVHTDARGGNIHVGALAREPGQVVERIRGGDRDHGGVRRGAVEAAAVSRGRDQEPASAFHVIGRGGDRETPRHAAKAQIHHLRPMVHRPDEP